MMWISDFDTKFDECDGEPLCRECESLLESTTDELGIISVRCVMLRCPMYERPILKASTYDEITKYFLAKYHEFNIRQELY
jgi:hypothetical protein